MISICIFQFLLLNPKGSISNCEGSLGHVLEQKAIITQTAISWHRAVPDHVEINRCAAECNIKETHVCGSGYLQPTSTSL